MARRSEREASCAWVMVRVGVGHLVQFEVMVGELHFGASVCIQMHFNLVSSVAGGHKHDMS